MATRSAIGIKHGSVIKAIYCHWDGYLTGVGRTLINHYSRSPTVNKLISMGNASALGVDIADTNFYVRDRDESMEEEGYITFFSEAEFIEGYGYVEYYYLYDNGTWYYATPKNKTFEPLETAVVMEALTQ